MQGVSFKELVEKGKTPRDWRKSLYYHYYEFPGFHSVRAIRRSTCATSSL